MLHVGLTRLQVYHNSQINDGHASALKLCKGLQASLVH